MYFIRGQVYQPDDACSRALSPRSPRPLERPELDNRLAMKYHDILSSQQLSTDDAHVSIVPQEDRE